MSIIMNLLMHSVVFNFDISPNKETSLEVQCEVLGLG